MKTQDIVLRRLPIVLRPDAARVLVRPFFPAAEPQIPHGSDTNRVTRVTSRVRALSEIRVEAELAGLMSEFGSRHADLRTAFADRFVQVCDRMPTAPAVPDEMRRLLIGAYFSHEYSFEAAALFNPSIVLHPDQSGLAASKARFIVSLRATGEGHISSICFRSVIVDADGEVRLEPPGIHATTPVCDGPIQADGSYEVAFPPDYPSLNSKHGRIKVVDRFRHASNQSPPILAAAPRHDVRLRRQRPCLRRLGRQPSPPA